MSDSPVSLNDFDDLATGDIIEVEHVITGRFPDTIKQVVTRLYLIMNVRTSALSSGDRITTCLTSEGSRRNLRLTIDDLVTGKIRLVSRMTR